jgi:hypothetical protein
MKWLIITGVSLLTGVVVHLIYSFLRDLNKDNNDLEGISASDKFKIIVHELNRSAFNGKGDIIQVDKRNFNLYEDGSNQIIQFEYSTGILTIRWRFKYFHREVIHEKHFHDARNLSDSDQNIIALELIAEMSQIIETHKRKVLSASL